MATSQYVTKTLPRPGSASRAARRRTSATQAAVTTFLMMLSDTAAVGLAIFLSVHIDRPLAAWLEPLQLAFYTGQKPAHLGYALFFIGVLLAANYREHLYTPLRFSSAWTELHKTVQSCVLAGLLLCGALFMSRNEDISRAGVLYVVTLTTAILCVLRLYWRRAAFQRFDRGLDTRNVLILGATPIGRMLSREITGNTHLGRVFKGFVQVAGETRGNHVAPQSVVGHISELRELVRRHFADEIVIAKHCPTGVILDLVEMGRELDIEISVMPGFYEEFTPEAGMEYFGDYPVVPLRRRHAKAVAFTVKRVMDLAISSSLLLLALPLLAVIACLIRLDSSGPLFYVSERIGRKGRTFRCFKFRTMVADAESLKEKLAAQNERKGILFKMEKDPRITRIGRLLRKYSLDEIPQLLNVLRGDMSLVGPRPPIASEVRQYDLEHFRRLEVLPGLTGLWQVRARRDPSFERYVALDLAYVQNWSVWMDLKILARTAEVVLRGTGA